MINEKEEKAKAQHLAIQSLQCHVTGDRRTGTSTTTSVPSLSVFNLLVNYNIAWTRVYIVAVLRLPPTEPGMRVAGLRGGIYFTHFKVVRVVRLAASIMERAHTSTKNDFLH